MPSSWSDIRNSSRRYARREPPMEKVFIVILRCSGSGGSGRVPDREDSLKINVPAADPGTGSLCHPGRPRESRSLHRPPSTWNEDNRDCSDRSVASSVERPKGTSDGDFRGESRAGYACLKFSHRYGGHPHRWTDCMNGRLSFPSNARRNRGDVGRTSVGFLE